MFKQQPVGYANALAHERCGSGTSNLKMIGTVGEKTMIKLMGRFLPALMSSLSEVSVTNVVQILRSVLRALGSRENLSPPTASNVPVPQSTLTSNVPNCTS